MRERLRPAYDAAGLRLGSIVVLPALSAQAQLTDNVFYSSARHADTIFAIEPRLTARSDWGRHSIALDAQSTLTRHVRNKSENASEWQVRADGRLDVRRTTTVTSFARLGDVVEPRYSPGYTVAAVEPVRYQVAQASMGASQAFNRVRISAQATTATYRFHRPPAAIPGFAEAFRNHSESAGTIRSDLSVGATTGLFSEMSATSSRYDKLRGTQDQDSSGYRALVGVTLAPTGLLAGELAVGFRKQQYKDPRLGNVSGLDARANLKWYPTELLTVGVTGYRTIGESGLLQAAASNASTIEAYADYELLRNLILSPRASYTSTTFPALARRYLLQRASISSDYLVNRTAHISFSYSHLRQRSSDVPATQRFSENRLGIALVLQK